MLPGLIVERIEGSPARAGALVHDLVAAYLDWAGAEQVARGRLSAVELHSVRRMVEGNVRAELPAMLAARRLIEELVAAARIEGYRALRLETADFMTGAHTLYRAVGFRDAPMFDGGEAVAIGLSEGMHFMELALDGI